MLRGVDAFNCGESDSVGSKLGANLVEKEKIVVCCLLFTKTMEVFHQKQMLTTGQRLLV